MSTHESPLPGNRLAHIDFDETRKYGDPETLEFTDDIDKANLLLSTVDMGPIANAIPELAVHRPVIDIDLPIQAIPSTTEGHFHLLIDKPMTWAVYSNLLHAMAAAGLVELGYVEAALRRGYTAVRLPWVKKEAK